MDEDKDWPWHCANCGEPLKAGDRVMNRADGHINEEGYIASMGDTFLYHAVCPGDEPPMVFIISMEDEDCVVVWSQGKVWEIIGGGSMREFGTSKVALVLGNALNSKAVNLDGVPFAAEVRTWPELQAATVKNYVENETPEAKTKAFHRKHCVEEKGDCPIRDSCGVNTYPDGHQMGGCQIDEFLQGTYMKERLTDEARAKAQEIVNEL